MVNKPYIFFSAANKYKHFFHIFLSSIVSCDCIRFIKIIFHSLYLKGNSEIQALKSELSLTLGRDIHLTTDDSVEQGVYQREG